MNKSIFERIFPHSPNDVLPHYSDSHNRPSASTRSLPQHITLRDSSHGSANSQSPALAKSSLKAAPLSASIVHHDDPFLPIDRAAKSLQRTIQTFLDAQAERLNASIGAEDDLSSVGSPTPTPSVATPTRSHLSPSTMPVRQPKPKRITLRGARKGIARAMQDFVDLKDEELRVIDNESKSRESALLQAQKYTDKRQSLEAEMAAIDGGNTMSSAVALRTEAGLVGAEIQELEHKLFELRSRHRHLVIQAEQLESSAESKMSSYKASLTMVDRDVKQFLRTPPVASSLSNYGERGSTSEGMYALKPERRTLEMAHEQWTAEQTSLALRKADVEDEKQALDEGARLWRAVAQNISGYEKELKKAFRASRGQSGDSNDHIDAAADHLERLDTLIASVSSALATAETKSWNLLIAALGAELEALQQGRILLGGGADPSPLLRSETNGTANTDDPPPDLFGGTPLRRTGSNQSLQDTLRELDDGMLNKGKAPVHNSHSQPPSPSASQDPWAPAAENVLAGKPQRRDYRSESEDDEPGPDFLVSQP